MRLRLFGIATALLFFVPAAANADAHRWGFGGGGSGASGSKVYGFYTSAEVVLADFIKPDSKYKYITLIGDFGITGGSHNGVDITRKTGGVGPGFRFARNATSKHVGGIHSIFGSSTTADGSATKFAAAVGGLYEFVPHRDDAGWETAFRVQYDRVISGDGNSFHRFSFGGVIRFTKQH